MARYIIHLQLVSRIFHEVKVHDVVYYDIQSKTTWKLHKCLS